MFRFLYAAGHQSHRPGTLFALGGKRASHYSMAQIMEIHAALEKITQPSNGWNKSLQTLKAENALHRANLGGGTR